MDQIWEFLVNPTVLVAVFLGGGALVLGYILKLFRNYQNDDANARSDQSHFERKKDIFSAPKSKKKATFRGDYHKPFSSPWILRNLKGHTGAILKIDYSSNGKYLASCGEDRAVLLWDVKDLSQKDRKSLRVNIDFDHATFVKWSPDSKAFIIQKYNENTIEVYKIEKKKDGWLGQATKALTFPKGHETDVIGIGIASNGKFIMTCSNKTDLIVWDLKGQQLATVDTYLMSTTCAKVSPCGKYIAASGFAPDAKVWEVVFTKSGEFKEVKRAFELSGHTSGIYDLSFDSDSSHIATISKDGTWKLFDIKIEYGKGEDPHLKITGKYEQTGNAALIALSPNAEVVAIATGSNLSFYSAKTGKKDHVITDLFAGNVTSLLFDAEGKYVIASGDKQIKVIQNVTGYRCAISSANEKLQQNQTAAMKERLLQIIKESEELIASIEK